MNQLDRRAVVKGAGALTVALGGALADVARGQDLFEPWRDLVNFLPNAADLNTARQSFSGSSVSMSVQRIEDATGDLFNMDFYAVDIARLPANYPIGTDFLKYVRQHLGDFFDPSISTLGYYTAEDTAAWSVASGPIRGVIAIFHIGVWGPLEEQAGVVTSRVSPTSWVFTPVTIGAFAPGEHPVSGNREFGILKLPNNVTRIYTRGADRVLASTVPGQDKVLEGGDELWKSWQKKVADFVTSNGGSAQTVTPQINRPTFASIRASGLFTR